MGMITDFFGMFFGNDRNALVETVEVFRENAEKAAVRSADYQSASLAQFAAEFQHQRKGLFDRFIDGLNRLPRPLMAFGTLGLITTAMTAPEWFSARMTGLALVPEPLWWLVGAIVSFYFGARHQAKGQDFQRAIASTLAVAPAAAPDAILDEEPAVLIEPVRAETPLDGNAALDDWRAQNGI